MKRLAILLITITTWTILSAQVVDSLSHEHRMIECINNGDFNCAISELSLVENWALVVNDSAKIDISKAIEFTKTIDTTKVRDIFLDSLSLYVAMECDTRGMEWADKSIYDSAIVYYELSAEFYKSIFGELHSKYATALFNLARWHDYSGDYDAKAEQYYVQAVNIRKQCLGNYHPDYLEALFCLGEYYYHETNPECSIRSLQCFAEVLKVCEDSLGMTYPSYIPAIAKLGKIYEKMENYNMAEKYYIKAEEVALQVYGDNHIKYADYVRTLGYFYNHIRQYSKAEPQLLKVASIRRNIYGERHEYYASSLGDLGTLYAHMENYANAERYLLEALHIRREELCEQSSRYDTLCYAGSLDQVGDLYVTFGDYSKAERCYLDALQIYKKKHSNYDYAKSMDNLGYIYRTRKDYDKAERCFLEALRINRKIFGSNNQNYAVILEHLGSLYRIKGDYAKAEQYYLEASQIIKRKHGAQHPLYASVLNLLGILYFDLNEYLKAEQYYLEALNVRKMALGEQDPISNVYMSNLGLLYYRVGAYEQAEQCFYQTALKKKSKFIKSLDFMSEQQRKLYWKTMQSSFGITYPRFSYVYSLQKPSISAFAYDNELFTKGLLLNSSESVKRSIMESGDVTLIGKWDKLIIKKNQIAALQETSSSLDSIKLLQEDVEQLEKQVIASSAAFRQSGAQWEITWDSVRNHLEDNQVAIEYMVASINKDSTMYCALLVRDNSEYPEMIPLFEEKEALSLINTTTGANTDITYSYDDNGKILSDLVWSKVLPRIQQGETIYFAPSGLLHQVAIEALPYDSVRTLGDVYNLVRLSSTREIVLNKQTNSHTDATLYGGIQYSVDAEELLAESEQYAASNLLASRGIENDTLNRGGVRYLPGTKKEVEQVNEMLNESNLHTHLYTSTSANEESFKALSGKHQNILHIATHGFYWADSTAQKKDFFSQHMKYMGEDLPIQKTIDPLNRCGLLMAGANIALSGHSADLPEGVQDGILTAKEISLLDLRDANLVVLSACETGKGEITGEGVFGLQRAFKQAGAQTIIMSLWPVNDAATQLLMTGFYRNWITNNQSKREAFRNAQNTVRSQYPAPSYWAGFIMLD